MDLDDLDYKDLLLSLVLSPFSYAWYAFVLLNLYTWHITQLGAPEIDYKQALGITLVVAFLKLRIGVGTPKDGFVSRTITGAIVVGVFFCIGWVLS